MFSLLMALSFVCDGVEFLFVEFPGFFHHFETHCIQVCKSFVSICNVLRRKLCLLEECSSYCCGSVARAMLKVYFSTLFQKMCRSLNGSIISILLLITTENSTLHSKRPERALSWELNNDVKLLNCCSQSATADRATALTPFTLIFQ